MKKAELSINFIIVLVIALIVLVVMIYIFTTNSTKANDDLSGCESKGGMCRARASDCPRGYASSGFFGSSCDDKGDVCCLPVDVDKNY